MLFSLRKEKKKDTSRRRRESVFIGLSGGVDSAVAAALLCNDGYDVFGVYIRTWQPDWMKCTWREERRDAMRVSAHLRIPFLELDLSEEYRIYVAEYFIDEYKKGRTPNPDVMCNKEIKFGRFYNWARTHGADYVATGHYSQILPLLPCPVRRGMASSPDSGRTNESDQLSSGAIYSPKTLGGSPHLDGVGMGLFCSTDTTKDQSYFLWTLKSEQLNHILFPIGNFEKKHVRQLAKKFGIPVAEKKDSQGICFIGDIGMKEFLMHYILQKRGDVLNTDGDIIGYHDGAVFYTIGERHGFIITKKGASDEPMYVVEKDIEENTITVAPLVPLSPSSDEGQLTYFRGAKINLISINDINSTLAIGQKLSCQIRYHGEIKSCMVSEYNLVLHTATVILDVSDATIASGQSLVIYDGDRCVGGGVIE